MDNKKDFINFLFGLTELKNGDAELLTESFRKMIVIYGSDTPDNLKSSELLSIKNNIGIGDTYNALKICLRRLDISVVDIMYEMEGSEIPDSIKEKYPELSHEEWTAVFRIVVLLLGLFEIVTD